MYHLPIAPEVNPKVALNLRCTQDFYENWLDTGYGMGWDGMAWDEMGQDEMGWHGMACGEMR